MAFIKLAHAALPVRYPITTQRS